MLAAEIAGNPLCSALKCWAAFPLKKRKVLLILAPNSAFSAEFPLKQQEIPLKKRDKLLKVAKSAASHFPALAALFCSWSAKKLLRYV
jgi:hypothetical protein